MREEELLALLVTLILATWLLRPIARALADRLSGSHGTVKEMQSLRDEVHALRDDLLEEQQLLRRELGELGERVDFAERLLARNREVERLPPGPT